MSNKLDVGSQSRSHEGDIRIRRLWLLRSYDGTLFLFGWIELCWLKYSEHNVMCSYGICCIHVIGNIDALVEWHCLAATTTSVRRVFKRSVVLLKRNRHRMEFMCQDVSRIWHLWTPSRARSRGRTFAKFDSTFHSTFPHVHTNSNTRHYGTL